MRSIGANHGPTPDRRDLEIERLKRLLEETRAGEGRVRAEERERFSVLSAASKRFAASMRSRMDERQRQQRRLDAQYALSRILEESSDFSEAAPQVFHAIAERLGWEAGVLWILEEGALRCREVWRLRGLPPDGAPSGGFEEACRRSALPRGAGLPGRVWSRGEACWVEDVQEDEGYPHRRAAAAEGLHCALAFPIRDGGRLIGVFELLREEKGPVEEDALRVAYLLGQQIGQFVERRRAEEEREGLRREAESGRARLRAVLQQMPDGVFIAEPGGRISLANEGATRIYGREIRSIRECGLYSLSYPEGEPIPQGDHPLDHALAGETISAEHFVERADGTRGVISTNSAPVLDDEGRVVAAVEAFQDVTELVEARRAVEESEQRLRTLTANIPGAVFRCVIDEKVPSMEFVSERIGEITGYPAAGFVADRARNYREVIHPEDRPGNDREVWRALEAGEPYNIEYRVLHAGGGVRWANERGSGVFSREGGLLWVDGIIFDVTERKEAEEERDRLLAHEWVAGAEAAERERISRELHDRVAHSMGVAHQSLQLYEILAGRDPERAAQRLELAREMTKAALESTRNLSAELRHLEAEEALETELRHLLDVSVPPHVGADLHVEGDEAAVPGYVRGQVFLVLREAVRNAVAHSGCASISVGLDMRPEEIVGRVEDDGLGFEATNGNGSVGLRSMRERAALLDGTLDLDCEPGRGTRVVVAVPLKGNR